MAMPNEDERNRIMEAAREISIFLAQVMRKYRLWANLQMRLKPLPPGVNFTEQVVQSNIGEIIRNVEFNATKNPPPTPAKDAFIAIDFCKRCNRDTKHHFRDVDDKEPICDECGHARGK